MLALCVVFSALLETCLCSDCPGRDVYGIEPEVSLLQLDMTLTNHTVLVHAEHGPNREEAKVRNALAASAIPLYNFSVFSLVSARNRVAMRTAGVSGSVILVDVLLVFVLAGVFICCWGVYLRRQNPPWQPGGPTGRRTPGAGNTATVRYGSQPGTATKLDPSTSMGAASMAAASVGAAPPGETDGIPPPIMCPDLVIHTQESRFRMSLQDALAESEEKFPITSPSGHTNFEAWIEGGRLLFIRSPGQELPRIMIDAPESENINVLNILDGRGSFWGTISLSPGRHGVYMLFRRFHGSEPAIRIRVLDLRTYRMQAESLSGSGMILASFALDGHLSCTVRSGMDPVLFLSTFLSLLVLKPALLEFAVDH